MQIAQQTAEEHAKSLGSYISEGANLAKDLGNRGPVRFDESGKLAEEILEAYWRTGFYVFEGVIEQSEIDSLRVEMADLLDRAPVDNGSTVDKEGRPAFGEEFARPTFYLVEPLSDPWGGTEILNGRHPTKMNEPAPSTRVNEKVVFIMNGMCQTMPSGLCLYGHPDLLGIAASINGDDFVPYNDATFVKQPGVGGSVSWHQDGVTHWKSPDWDQGIHGFNFQVQLYDTSARSCLWVVPGTHKLGKIDIKQRLSESSDSELMPGAVPLACKAGDVTVVNRQALHGSFANTSNDLRISLTFGFHRRKSVIGAKGALSESADAVYDEARVFERSKVIGYAINARAETYPEESRFDYLPMRGHQEELLVDEDNWEKTIKDYNLNDLSI